MKPATSIILFITIFCSCSTPKSTSDSPVTEEDLLQSTVLFTANPQAVPEQDIKTLAIGAQAPDFNLPATDGQFYRLSDFSQASILVIIFTCNHCPTAQAYEDRIKQIVKDYAEKGVQVLAISPNSVRGILLNELAYSDVGDSFEDMVIRARDKEYNFPYLYDGDTHEASMQYGPVATPQAFVFDNERRLTYVGRLDKSEKPGTANAEDLRQAIDFALAGKPLAQPSTKTFGCSVKWAWNDKYRDEFNAEWAEIEVALEDVDSEDLMKVMSNNSDKLRLINLWATWCGPCVVEYPQFLDIHRMFELRDFEFVSVSADNIESRDKVLSFLKKKHSAVKNYLFSEQDKYSLIESVDPEWDGALPYTALIEPGGKIYYKKMGSIDPMELRKIIVEHPMIGRYY